MSSPYSWLSAGKLLAVMVLVLANGFFVAAEFSLVAVRRSRVEQLIAEGRPRAKDLKRALKHLDAYLAATQLGITMSSLGLGWLGEPALAALLEPAFKTLLPESLSRIGAHTISVIIAFTLITALHIVLGEIAPKSLALQRPEATSLFVIKGLDIYLAIFGPAVYFLNNLGNLVLKLLGLHAGTGEELVHSPEELRLLVSASRQAGLLGETEQDVVERVFRLGELRVSVFMTPRLDIVWLDLEDPLPNLRQTVATSVYSRFLVCQGSIDNCLGFVGAKEFLAGYLGGPMTVKDLKGLLTQPLYMAESMRSLNALKLFKNSGSHIAVVVDEYGAIQGLVTLNDILEAIVGDIQTGKEPTEPQAIQGENGSWLLDGMLSIEEFKDIFQPRKLPEGDGVDYLTVGGLVLTQLGRIPSVAESFEWEGLHFEVISMDGHRVDQVRVIPILGNNSLSETSS